MKQIKQIIIFLLLLQILLSDGIFPLKKHTHTQYIQPYTYEKKQPSLRVKFLQSSFVLLMLHLHNKQTKKKYLKFNYLIRETTPRVVRFFFFLVS